MKSLAMLTIVNGIILTGLTESIEPILKQDEKMSMLSGDTLSTFEKDHFQEISDILNQSATPNEDLDNTERISLMEGVKYSKSFYGKLPLDDQEISALLSKYKNLKS